MQSIAIVLGFTGIIIALANFGIGPKAKSMTPRLLYTHFVVGVIILTLLMCQVSTTYVIILSILGCACSVFTI